MRIAGLVLGGLSELAARGIGQAVFEAGPTAISNLGRDARSGFAARVRGLSLGGGRLAMLGMLAGFALLLGWLYGKPQVSSGLPDDEHGYGFGGLRPKLIRAGGDSNEPAAAAPSSEPHPGVRPPELVPQQRRDGAEPPRLVPASPGLGGGAAVTDLAVLLPLMAAIAVAAVPRSEPGLSRAVAVLAGIVELGLLLSLVLGFDIEGPSVQMTSKHAWLPAHAIAWSLGVEGSVLPLLLLLGVAMPLALAIGDRSTDARSLAGLLVLQAAWVTVVLARDLVLLAAAWEVACVTTVILAGGWKRRGCASACGVPDDRCGRAGGRGGAAGASHTCTRAGARGAGISTRSRW